MTTLPQTTVRVPRSPSSAMAPFSGLPTNGAAAPAAGSAAAYAMTGADVRRVLRANALLILSLVVVGAIIGFCVNYVLAKYRPSYRTSALLFVSAPPSMDPLKAEQSSLDVNVQLNLTNRNALFLKQTQLYSEVLRDSTSQIRDTTWFKQFPSVADAKQDLIDNLEVTPVLDSGSIKVQMTTRQKDDGTKIIEAVVDKLIEAENKQNAAEQENRNVQLSAMKQSAELRRTELQDDLQAKEARLNISVVGSGRLNVKETAMSDLTKYKMDAELRYSSAQQQADHAEQQIKDGQDPAYVLSAVNADQSVLRYQQLVNNEDLELLREAGVLGPESTAFKQLQQEHDLFAKKLQQAQNDVKSASRITYLEEVRRERDSAKQAVDRVNEQINALDTEIQGLNKDLGDYTSEQAELNDLNAKLKQIDDQRNQIANFENQKDLTNLEWRSHPEPDDTPAFPKLKVTMGVSIMLALMAGLGIAFLREMMDTTVRCPRDITRIGQMTVLGMIPHEDDDPQAAGTRLPLVIFEAPQSNMAEQLRHVRTRLQHAAGLDTTRTILITSPSPDDGKSTIAANLASGLALNGRRILLVDANFRRPAVHKMFKVSNDVGFGDVLNKLDSFASAIQETVVPNLYVLPSGVKPANATELLESQLLTDFIERALEEFDHVIFDSGPLLLVSETAAMAPRVDGVVTVVRARTNTRGLLQRLRDTLRQIKAEHLGVVLNAVRTQGGGYYRSNIRTYYDYQNGHS